MQRRELLASAATLAGGAALFGGLAGCGTERNLIRVEVGRAQPDPGRAADTVDAVGRFSVDLLARLGSNANLVCSPLSVLVAFAMVRNGAAGTTAAELDRAFRFPAVDDLNSGMNTIDQTLTKRSGKRRTGERKGKVELDLANAVWGQQGYTWGPAFLRSLAADYGTGVHTADFQGHEAGARRAINDWVADRTHDKITDIATPDVINADTRLALVNALYVKAPWADPFFDLGDRPFTIEGVRVPVAMIGGMDSPRYLSGPGWQGARIPLLGNELALTMVLPDRDVRALVGALRTTGLASLLHVDTSEPVDLTLPKFTIRSTIDLKPPLNELGVQTAFTGAAEFPGLTSVDRLMLQAAKHMGYVALDQDGVEAAAATVVSAMAVSGSARPERSLVLDRPFLFVLHDLALALPIMLGVVVDPR